MKKLFSLLAMAAMVFTACQNDEGVKNPTLADEGIVNLSVGVPELATRVTDGDGQYGFDSAYGAIDWAENSYTFLQKDYDIRFQLAVYEAGADENAEPIYTKVQISDFTPGTNFNDLRFVPGREYQFVIFADLVPQGTEGDFRYNTADLRNITTVGNSKLNAMDETFDAYFASEAIKIESGKLNEPEITLRRPFAKVRVLTTDLAWVENYAVPAEGTVTFYNHQIYTSFNALTGEVATEAANDEETLTYAIDPAYYAGTMYNNDEAFTLFTTYVLATNAQEAVNFRLDTFEADGSLIKSLDFNTEIPVQRNHLTTLVGNLLTNEADLTIRIDDNFDAEHFQNGDFENLEEGLGFVREGEFVGGQVYRYETNLFSFRLLSETDGTELREGTYKYSKELLEIQSARAFDVAGIDVEKGTLTIEKRNTRAAGDSYYVVFDIYATINGVTENYILTWNGELKAPRTPLAEPVVTYEVDEVEALYITFSWEAVEGAKNYTVEWNGEKQTVEGTSVTFDFAGVDTKATAYVTANPEFTWSNTASTGSVTVDWKKPIVYTEVEVYLQYVKDNEVAFYNDNYTVYFQNYPSFEGAWYQVKGQIPTPFSAEANLVEVTGNDAKVAIYEPTTATCFLYKGAMNPYILTEAEVNWLAGYNTVKVLFSNKAGDAIEFQTTAPMEAGHATIEPTYVAIGGDQAANIESAEMNVLLENGEYTIFFTIHSAINDVLMQYVGAIDFEKPYAPQYVLESYTAGAETIYFEGENAEFEIEATSLESGDVAVKKLILDGSDDYAAAGQVTAATAVVKEENGVYDARYTVTVNLPIVGDKTFDLQYVGTFVPYSAPVEPEKPIEFEATYEVKAGAYIFTGVNYDFTILVNKLGNTEYITGETYDAWAYDWTLGQPMNNFRTGDFLTVENNVVTVEFTAAPFGQELRYKMTCDMNETPAEPETTRVKLAQNGDMYEGGNYTFIQDQGAWIVRVNNQTQPSGFPVMINLTEENVNDAADELVFTFFDSFNNVNVTALYQKVPAPVAPVFDYNFDTITLNSNTENGVSFRVKDNAGNYVDFVVNTADATAKSIKAAEYTFGMDYPYDNAGKFTFTKAGLESGTWYKSYNQFVGGSLKVSLNDKVYTIEMSISLSNDTTETARFEGIGVLTGEEQPVTPPTQDPTNLSETAVLGDVAGFPAYLSDTYQIVGEQWKERANLNNYGKCEIEKTANGYIFTFFDEKNNRNVTITYTEKSTEPEQTVVENIKATYKNGTFGKMSVNFADANNADNNFDCTFTYSNYTPNGTYTIGENAAVENGTGTIVVTVNDPNYSFNIDATVNGVVYKGTVTIAL